MNKITSDIFVTEDEFNNMLTIGELTEKHEDEEKLYVYKGINSVFRAKKPYDSKKQGSVGAGILLEFVGLD